MEIVRIPRSLEKETRGHLENKLTVPLEKELFFFMKIYILNLIFAGTFFF